jgi:hypothetical protein
MTFENPKRSLIFVKTYLNLAHLFLLLPTKTKSKKLPVNEGGSMNKEDQFKFNHELPKAKNSLTGKVSSPLCLAQLLTELLQINQTSGKIIYDCCFGVGALSSQVDTNKHVLVGDDKELEYLKLAQQNNPQAILFNHDTFKCQGPPCWEHLITSEWKQTVEDFYQQRENQLDPVQVQAEYERLMANGYAQKSQPEKETLAKQKILELLIKQEAKKKGEPM